MIKDEGVQDVIITKRYILLPFSGKYHEGTPTGSSLLHPLFSVVLYYLSKSKVFKKVTKLACIR